MVKKAPKPKRQFGVKDPLKQLEERENKIKDKINNPPAKDENQQALSQKMKRFLELKNETKPTKKPDNSEQKRTKLIRQKGETEENYLKRQNRLTNTRITESLYAAKYNLKITRNETTGELKINQGGKNEIDELLLAKKLGKKKLRKKDPEAKKAGLLKLKQKKKDKKVPKIEVDLLRQHEVIAFGDRVDAPPTLVTPRKATKNETKSKNARSGLLLTQMLSNAPPSVEEKRKQIDFERIRIEKERASIVNLYKELKRKRRNDDKLKGIVKKYEPGSSL